MNKKSIISIDIAPYCHPFQINGDSFVIGSHSQKLLKIHSSFFEALLLGDSFSISLISKKLQTADRLQNHRQSTTQTLTIFMTHACNRNCQYCYDRFSTQEQICDIRRVQSVIRSLDRKKNLSIQFFGGEPLLEYYNIQQITAFCDNLAARGNFPSVSYPITTNGVLLTQEIVDFFNSHRFYVNVSIDGYRDPLTGNDIGSSHKILSPEQLHLISHIKHHTARITVMPSDICCLSDLVSALYREGIDRIAVAPAVDKSITYTSKDAEEWIHQMYVIAEKTAAGILPKSFIMNFAAVIGRMKAEAEPCECDMIAMDTDGTLYPCHRFAALGEKYSVENIEKRPKTDIGCENCWAYRKCAGACLYDKYLTDHNTQDFLCRIRKREVELACWIAAGHRKEPQKSEKSF